MTLFQSAVQHLLFPTLVVFLFVGSVFALLVGAGLIVNSGAMLRFFGLMNRWVSTRGALKPVEVPHNVEQAGRRQRRLLGAVFLAGAAFSLVVLTRTFDVGALVSVFQHRFSPMAARFAVMSLKWILLVGNAAAIIVGLMLIAFPDALARVEARLNRWHSTRVLARDLDIVHLTLDKWVEANPRAAGWGMILLAGFVVINLGLILFVRR